MYIRKSSSVVWLDSVKHPGVYQQPPTFSLVMHARQKLPPLVLDATTTVGCGGGRGAYNARTYKGDGNIVFVVVLTVAVRTCVHRRQGGGREGEVMAYPPNGVRSRVATLLTRRRSARRVAADSRRAKPRRATPRWPPLGE